MPEWDEQGNPIQEWDEQGNPASESPFQALRGAKIEPQPSLLSRIGSQTKGFFQELPLIAARGASLVQDLSENKRPWDPSVAAERASREERFNEMLGLGGAKPGEPEQRVGRMAARMVPGAAAAYLTGGMSLPAQAAIQGGVQGLQSLSEGASPEGAITGGVLAAGASPFGAAINRAGSFVKAPFKKAVDQGVVQAAGNLGVELPAGAITNSSRARGLEQMASRMIGGGQIEARGVQALDEITGKAGQMGSGANPMLAGQKTAADYAAEASRLQGISGAEYGKLGDLTSFQVTPGVTADQLEAWIKQGTMAPDQLETMKKLLAAVSPEPPALPPGLQQALDQYKNDPKMQAIILQQAGIQSAAPTPRSVANLMSEKAGIRYGGPNATGEAAIDNRLRDLLGQDVDAALLKAKPDEAAQLKVAQAAHKQYRDLTDSELATQVAANKPQGRFDKIPDALLGAKASTTDLKRLMDVTTPQTQDQIREVLMRKIVGNAENVTPKQLQRGLYTYGKAAKVILTPEQLQTLRDLAKVREAMGKTTIGSPTTPLLQARKYIETPARALAAGSVGGLAGIGAELGTEALIARLLGSKGGQKWLTKGFGPSVIPGSLAKGAGTVASRVPSEYERQQRERELEALLEGQ